MAAGVIVTGRVQFASWRACVLSAFAALALSSCQWDGARPPSVLVLAIDTLPADFVSCTDQETASGEPSGLDLLCAESVRFTHAYTPSVLAQPALASVLTAKPPQAHGVIHNGPVFLPARFRTAAEVALEKRYKTFFASGGAPIFKKSGLDQGFEVFDDNFLPELNKFHNSFEHTGGVFLSWLKRQSESRPYFAVFYVPDLQDLANPGTDAEGRPVPRSFEGRFELFDSRLAKFIQDIKSLNRWNDTHVFLAGLNGRPRFERAGELDGYNLLSGNTQVGLLIKPAQKKRDLGIQWKIDANVSLLDVSATIFDLLGEKTVSEEPFGTVSLTKAMASPDVTWDPERPLMIESGWSQWHQEGRVRLAIRRGHYLYLHEFPPRIFNSLTDRLETAPLRPTHSRWAETIAMFAPYTASLKTAPWTPPPTNLIRRVQFAQALWNEGGIHPPESYLEQVLSGPPDPLLGSWFAQLAIERSDWNYLLKLGKKYKDQRWIYLASNRLRQKTELPQDGCFSVLKSKEFSIQKLKSCDDHLFRELLTWIRLSGSPDAGFHRDAFLKSYHLHMLDRRIERLNYVNGLVWDLDIDRPRGPAAGEILMYLPENQKFLAQAQERVRASL
ncbi:MAG TPA: sulfatase-like hydrolase/transferase [Bdellovibrionales bacterium]|nr:sulfatase-like hydrolase/transferase [Bdellovibrionales bacterium]